MSTKFKPKDANTPITAEWLNSVDDLVLMDLPASIATVQANLTAFQVSLANTAGPSEGAALIGRGIQSALTFAELRTFLKTSASDQAMTVAKTVPGDGGFGFYKLDPTDNTTPDDNWNTIVAADGGRWKRLNFIRQDTTTATDVYTSRIDRVTSHSGGTPGFVNSALRVNTTVGAAVANFEWSILGTMDNSATAGENVAVYGQAIKRSTGPTWAGCLEIQDLNPADPAVGGALGLELTCTANGGDTSFQRNGLDVAMRKANAGGTTCEWGNGVRTTAGTDSRYGNAFKNEGPFRVGAFHNSGDSSALAGSATFKDTGKASLGIDLTAAIYSADAIRLASGQKISFEPTSIVRLFESSGRLVSAERLQMSKSFYIPSVGNTSATATAGTSGAPPAQVAGYVIFQIDGTNFKYPYYQA